MKALISRSVGGPQTLELAEVPEPEAAAGRVVVAVRACGVNFPDVLIIEDKYQLKPPRPFSPGMEISGVVAALGEGVEGVKVGDRVLTHLDYGGMAERAAVDARRLVKIPDSMPFDLAAAFQLTYSTSLYALKNRGRLQAGETLLVLGAAGGVGLAAVEIGKAMGARVVAACSSQEKVDLACAHGADAGLVYPRGLIDREGQRALSEQFKSACGGMGPDVIYDAVGGDYAEPALRSIAWDGRYLVIGFAAGDIPRIPLNLALLKGCDIVGVYWGGWSVRSPESVRDNVMELFQMYGRGELKPHVSAHYELARGAEAIAALADRKATGKVIVTVGEGA